MSAADKGADIIAASAETQTMFGVGTEAAAKALIYLDRIPVSENKKMERPLVLVRNLEETRHHNTLNRGRLSVRIEDLKSSYATMEAFRTRCRTIAKEAHSKSYDGGGRLIVSKEAITIGPISEARQQEKQGQGDYYKCNLTIYYG